MQNIDIWCYVLWLKRCVNNRFYDSYVGMTHGKYNPRWKNHFWKMEKIKWHSVWYMSWGNLRSSQILRSSQSTKGRRSQFSGRAAFEHNDRSHLDTTSVSWFEVSPNAPGAPQTSLTGQWVLLKTYCPVLRNAFQYSNVRYFLWKHWKGQKHTVSYSLLLNVQ